MSNEVFTDWHNVAEIARKTQKEVTVSAERIIELDDAIQDLIRLFLNRGEEIDRLEEDSKKLAALEQGGVDNWEGYSYSMSLMDEEEDE